MKLELTLTERRRGAVGHVVPRKTTSRATPGKVMIVGPSRHSSSAPARASRRMTARGVAPASSTRVDEERYPQCALYNGEGSHPEFEDAIAAAPFCFDVEANAPCEPVDIPASDIVWL